MAAEDRQRDVHDELLVGLGERWLAGLGGMSPKRMIGPPKSVPKTER